MKVPEAAGRVMLEGAQRFARSPPGVAIAPEAICMMQDQVAFSWDRYAAMTPGFQPSPRH
jgi:hypothetical protein